MGSESPFGDLVHFFASYLYFYPIAVGTHDREMQSFVSIGFGAAHPVAGAFGVQFVDVGDDRVNGPALFFLVGFVGAFENDTNRIEVVDFLERYVFRLHLVPNGIDGFYPGFHLEFEPHFFELRDNRLGEVVVDLLARFFALGDFLLDLVVSLGVFVFEGEVFQLGLYGEQS